MLSFSTIGDSIWQKGPQISEYDTMNTFFMSHYQADKESLVALFSFLRYKISAFHREDSIAGFSFLRPHGYAGDFEMIDRLYTGYISGDETIRYWDLFAQAQPAAKAVRNRKNYFIELLQKNNFQSVLNLASGPGRDLKDYFDAYPNSSKEIDCVELDRKAIAYAQALLNYHPNVRFIHQNVLRFSTPKTYDLIWSAGLFDYFTDAVFVRVLRRVFKNVKRGGHLVIGNFADTNPNRAFMEVAMEWHLHHRSEQQLKALALQAGAAPAEVRVRKEEEGVNLFLHIEKK